MNNPKIEFWFEFASTYSYLSALRFPFLAAEAGVKVVWRPFLLGPIFKAQGWKTSPFNIYAAKGNYMWRDIERRSVQIGIEFHRPNPFPQNGLLAARTAQLALKTDHGIAFCQNIFLAQFAAQQDISDPAVVTASAIAAGLEPESLTSANDEINKHALRLSTQEAGRKGLFGAPSFIVGDELFWGDDRLKDALDYAKSVN